MRIVCLALFAACSASAPAVATATPTRVTAARTATTVATPPPPPPPVETQQAPPPPPPPDPTPPPPKVVLHLGDSMVGGYGGLTKALESRFKELGSKFVRDWQVSLSILTFDHERWLEELLAKHSPDLVILTLGANDVFVPYPSSLASSVRSIARKMSGGGRACYWIGPPVWKKDTGIVAVIKQNAAPCKVFDASYMTIARAGDGIHPTDRGGVTWADGFFDFYRGIGPATPNEPTP
jgi:acyl-CoA thioesterase-1